MTLHRIGITAALCLMALPLALSGCSNGTFAYGKAFGDLSTITGIKTGLEEKSAATPAAAPAPAPAGPPLIVGYEAIRVALPYAGQSGVSQTYVSPDGVTIAMTNGFVTRAIGLGIDANGIYLPADSAWFGGLAQAAEAGATTDRVAEYWKEERITRDAYRCSLSAAPRKGGGTVIDETCKRYFEPASFTNRYWLAADNTVECSRQWIHPKLSPLQFFKTEQQAVTLNLTKNDC